MLSTKKNHYLFSQHQEAGQGEQRRAGIELRQWNQSRVDVLHHMRSCFGVHGWWAGAEC